MKTSGFRWVVLVTLSTLLARCFAASSIVRTRARAVAMGRNARNLSFPVPRVWSRRLFTLAWLIGCAGAAVSAHADNCTVNSPSLSFTLPTGTYTIPRDATTGTQLTPFTSIFTGAPFNNVWTCDILANTAFGPASQALGIARTGGTYTATNGVTYYTYATNLAGVGLVVGVLNMLPSGWGPPGWGLQPSWHAGNLWSITGPVSGKPFGVTYIFAYVKTGPMTGGTTNVGGVIAQSAMKAGGVLDTSVVNVTVSGSATFIVAACKTPDVIVSLGSHKLSEMSGPNSFTASTPFNIELQNCPAGMNTVKYSVSPVTAVVDASNSVVALDATSSASGVGVQLLDGAGSVFPLNTDLTFSDYNGATGGSYVIPFRARYFQTASQVSPGTANSAMTFTMTYL